MNRRLPKRRNLLLAANRAGRLMSRPAGADKKKRHSRLHAAAKTEIERSSRAAISDTSLTKRPASGGRLAKLRNLEASLFLSREPVSVRKLVQLADLSDVSETRMLVSLLNQYYDSVGRAFRVESVAGGYLLMTRPELSSWLRRLVPKKQQIRLSPPSMETLVVVAYRQPVMRSEIDGIRGVNCGEILRQLMEVDLVKISGRSEDLGRPYLYSTTNRFLKHFGLNNLDELPKTQSMLQSVENELSDPNSGHQANDALSGNLDGSDPLQNKDSGMSVKASDDNNEETQVTVTTSSSSTSTDLAEGSLPVGLLSTTRTDEGNPIVTMSDDDWDDEDDDDFEEEDGDEEDGEEYEEDDLEGDEVEDDDVAEEDEVDDVDEDEDDNIDEDDDDDFDDDDDSDEDLEDDEVEDNWEEVEDDDSDDDDELDDDDDLDDDLDDDEDDDDDLDDADGDDGDDDLDDDDWDEDDDDDDWE